MPRITLRLTDAKELARAIAPHASRDDVTPVLTGIAVGGEHGSFAYSTDRYTVGRYDLTNVLMDDGVPDEEMWIPRAALSWVMTIGKAWFLNPFTPGYIVHFETVHRDSKLGASYTSVTLEWRGEEVTEVHAMRTFPANGAKGNFPPVSRLFREFVRGATDRTTLKGEHLDKFVGYSKYAREIMQVTLPEAPLRPVLIEIGKRFKGLIQPHLAIGPDPFGTDLAADNAERIADRDPGFSTTQTNGDSKDADTDTTPSAQG